MSKTYCIWRDNDEYFETDCDNVFGFISDGIEENGFVYCPYCGAIIHEGVSVEDAIRTVTDDT